jgi:hypothetical protein
MPVQLSMHLKQEKKIPTSMSCKQKLFTDIGENKVLAFDLFLLPISVFL